MSTATRRHTAQPTVAVVIAAYDEAKYIGECLGALASQTCRPSEIVVVDDGSRDATPRIAERADGVRVIRQRHRGAAVARNVGVAATTSDIVVFLDADMICPPPFIERLVAPMIVDGATGTFTKEILVANGTRRWARAHMLGRGLPADQHFRPGFPDRFEIFRAIWRADFERVGGFDDVGYGEDVTLGRKLGEDAVVAPGATCYHYEPDSIREIFSSARWVGRGERLRENPSWHRAYRPVRAARRAMALVRAHRMPLLLLYRLIWDTGVVYGALTRRWAHHAK